MQLAGNHTDINVMAYIFKYTLPKIICKTFIDWLIIFLLMLSVYHKSFLQKKKSLLASYKIFYFNKSAQFATTSLLLSPGLDK